MLFTLGNLSEFAITKFISEHQCNEFCKILDLPELSEGSDSSAVGGEPSHGSEAGIARG